MSRPPRFGLSGIPHHVVQLGCNHAPAFFCDDDFLWYKACLGHAATEHYCRVHAYTLAPNQVHLLITPDQPHAIAHLMQSIGRTYVQHVNRRLNRIGTLWAGRYKASLVEPGSWLVRTQLCIEHLPVRLGLVRRADEYLWSSCPAHTNRRPDAIIVDHASYLELGTDAQTRARAYCAMGLTQCDTHSTQIIERALAQCAVVGGPVFQDTIAQLVTRTVHPGQRGRPPKCRHRGEEQQGDHLAQELDS
jgi:putative transposase